MTCNWLNRKTRLVTTNYWDPNGPYLSLARIAAGGGGRSKVSVAQGNRVGAPRSRNWLPRGTVYRGTNGRGSNRRGSRSRSSCCKSIGFAAGQRVIIVAYASWHGGRGSISGRGRRQGVVLVGLLHFPHRATEVGCWVKRLENPKLLPLFKKYKFIERFTIVNQY